MKLPLIRFATAAALCAAVAFPVPSYAGGGDVAAGIIGGLAVGAIIGSAAASQPRPYYAPAPVYMEPAPVYMAPPPRCYWTRGEAFWDGYRWVRPRMQVCD